MFKHYKNIPGRVYLKYCFLQIPALALISILLFLLNRYLALPLSVICVIISLWILKDIFMFPFVWRSYDSAPENILSRMVGKSGTVYQQLDPEGYVQIGIERWKARSDNNAIIEKDEKVTIQHIDGLILTVKKISVLQDK